MGQDGSYLCDLLLSKGYEVFGVTRDVKSHEFNRLEFLQIENEIQLLELSNCDNFEIEIILSKYRFDEIYNLSAQSSVGQSFIEPANTLQFNVLSVLFWLEAIKKIDPNIKFYQASSSEMFGNVTEDKLPIKESLFFKPASPYGVSKAAAHWLTVNYREAYSIFACCGILFNHESCLRGSNYVIKKVINAAIKIKLGLSNKTIKVGNLDVYRDWGYAPEYVNAMWLMLQRQEPDDFLICSGNVISLREIVEKVLKILDLDFDRTIKIDPFLYRPVDLTRIVGDNSKAKKILNWKYDLSTDSLIDKLIQDEFEFIEWELKNKRK
jgi:GDPmannose 4,6-dehydratase